MQPLQCTAPLPGGSGQWNPCNALPHCLGAVGSATPAIRCRTVWGQWAAEVLQFTAPLPGGSGQWTSGNTLPHRLGAVGSATPAMHCLTAWGQWAVELLQCTASLPGASGQCNHLQRTAPLPGGSGQCNSCNALPHCLGAVDSATPAIHCRTAWGQWAERLLQGTASLPGGSGQWNSCNALPHCLGAADSAISAMHCLTALGAVGSATPAMHCLTAWGQWTVQFLQCTASLPWGQWAVELLQCTAPLPGGSGQWNPCNALPHCLGAVGGAAPAIHCRTVWGQWAAQFLQCTAALPGGSATPAMHCPTPWGQWTVQSCNALLHCLGAVGSATPAMHCLTAWGQWAVQLLQWVVGVSCRACGEVEPGTPAWGDGESCPRGGRSVLHGLWGCTTRRTGLGGWGVHPRGWSGHPSGPMWGHHLRRTGRTGPGGDGESSPGGGRSLPQGPWGASIFQEPGAPVWGGRGVLPRGWPEYSSGPMGRRHIRRTGRTGLGGTGSPAQGAFGASCKAHAEAPSSNNRAHRPGGGRGVQPRGWSESPARPMGSHHLPITGRTGLGGTGSPAQGVFGASCKAHGEASSFKNRAHRPRGDRESCPGGVRSLLQGLRGAIFVREPGAPAWGGQGVLPRGCSEPPARLMGGHLCQRTGRTGLG